MVRIIKKSDLPYLLVLPVLFTAFFLTRPLFSVFTGVETNWWELLRVMGAVVTSVFIVYFTVIGLRIRDHWREVTSSETSETTSTLEEDRRNQSGEE